MFERPILLTGCRGQVGAVLASTLPSLGPVVSHDRTSLDMADLTNLQRVVREVNPVLIVNAAAYTAVDRAEEEPGLADLINHSAVRMLAEEAHRCGASLVHYSTDYVFDGAAHAPYRPEHPTNPLGVYGTTKRDGERAILDSGVDHIILRTSWVYSTRGRNFLLTMLRLAAERDELRIVEDQVGSPTWADWLARATAQIIASRHKGRASSLFEGVGGVYHLTSSGRTTWCGFARAIFARANTGNPPTVTGIPTSEYPTPAARPAYSVLDCSETERVFGVSRPAWSTSLDDAIAMLSER